MGHQLSARARQLALFLASRNTPTQALPATEVATIISSRRFAAAVMTELAAAGLVQCIKDFLLPTPSILEFTAACVEGAGQVVEPAAHDLQAAPLAPSGSARTLNARNTPAPSHAQPEDLRVRQRALVLERSSLQRPALRVSSFPEGEAYETSNLGLDNQETNTSNLYNNIIPIRVRARSQDHAKASAPTVKRPRIYVDSRIGSNSIADSTPRRVDRQAMAKACAKRAAAEHTTSRVTVALGDEGEAAKAYGVAVAYEEQLGVYLCKPTLRYLKGRVAPGQPNYALWVRAAGVADELGLDYATFVRAQFWAFNAWYNRPPKPQELGSRVSAQSSAERARQYLEAVRNGTVTAGANLLGKQREIVDTTTARGRAASRVDKDTKFRHSEQQLRTLMKNFGVDEEQAIRTFAKGATATVYFDREWLKQNPTYQRLMAAGEL